MKALKLNFKGAIFNADSAFDSTDTRKVCWNHHVIQNIDKNKRNRKKKKRCKKRHFNKEVYKNRFCIERTFAWIDKFKRLLIRFERVDTYFVVLLNQIRRPAAFDGIRSQQPFVYA